MAKKIKSRAHVPTILKHAKAHGMTPYWCPTDGIYTAKDGLCPFCGTKGEPYQEVNKK